MNYKVKTYEMELNSKDHPKLSHQAFEAMVEEQTQQFIGTMVSLNTQFIAQQDLTALGVGTRFYFVAGCAAVRRTHVYDLPKKELFVRLEAWALEEIAEVEQLLPGEKQPATEASLRRELGMSN